MNIGLILSFNRGYFRLPDRYVAAHRASYRMFKGVLPEGHVIRHKCVYKWCVNPDCLTTIVGHRPGDWFRGSYQSAYVQIYSRRIERSVIAGSESANE